MRCIHFYSLFFETDKCTSVIALDGRAQEPAMKTELYSEELCHLQKLLHFPEEVALLLTETEYNLFNMVKPLQYVRHITMDMTIRTSQEDKQTVNILVQRFHEVSSM